MKVHMNSAKQIKERLGINPNGKVQKFFTDDCAKHMDKYVPMDTGILRTNIDKGTDYITYESPYAHYQYIGKLYVMDNGKGAYYNPNYGFWSKRGVEKKATDIDLNYTTPRYRLLLGQKDVECRRRRYNKRGARICWKTLRVTVIE